MPCNFGYCVAGKPAERQKEREKERERVGVRER